MDERVKTIEADEKRECRGDRITGHMGCGGEEETDWQSGNRVHRNKCAYGATEGVFLSLD